MQTWGQDLMSGPAMMVVTLSHFGSFKLNTLNFIPNEDRNYNRQSHGLT